jgi:hypothetical protein
MGSRLTPMNSRTSRNALTERQSRRSGRAMPITARQIPAKHGDTARRIRMPGKLASLILLSLAVVLHVVATPSAAGPITVQSLTYEGSGCPSGPAATNVSLDGSTCTILFDSYVPQVGPAVPKKEHTRECTVDALLQAPVGWSWAIIGVDHRGFVDLPTGASATVRSSFRFNRQRADQQQAPPLEAHFHGQISDDYLLTTDTPPLQIDWVRVRWNESASHQDASGSPRRRSWWLRPTYAGLAGWPAHATGRHDGLRVSAGVAPLRLVTIADGCWGRLP